MTEEQAALLEKRVEKLEKGFACIALEVKEQKQQFISIRNELHHMIRKLDLIIGR